MNRPPLTYRCLLAALALPLIGYSLWQAKKNQTSRLAYQRLGLKLPQHSDQPIWIHAASVGEINAALPLINTLRQRDKTLSIIITTITPTGANNAHSKLPADVEHVYLPLDFNCAIKRFLKQIKPRCALIMETEIWPNLFNQTHKAKIPLIIINGRLSHRTLDRPRWIRNIYQQAISQTDKILARSSHDSQSFQNLGATTKQIKYIGNIKFSQTKNDTTPETITLPRPFVVAASTHHDEELRLAKLWQHNRHSQTHTLVIVPRHPERGNSIMKQLESCQLNLAQRSREDAPTPETQLYLADTLGELTQFIAAAKAIIIGGSFINHGGQNILEAAHFGKTAICGPHMENFADETALLLNKNGALQVENETELTHLLDELLDDSLRLKCIGQQAKAALAEQADMAQRYVDAVWPYCHQPP